MVTCTRDNITIDTSLYTVSREVLQSQYVQNGEVDSVNVSEPDMPDVTKVTVTVREREAGEYECTVTVMGREDNTPTQVVTLGTPQSSTAMITGNLKCHYICKQSPLITVLHFSFNAVSGTPTNVVATRSSDTEVTVTWTAPSPVPDGYEVFYQVDGGDILSAGNTTNTMLTINSATITKQISYFVVAFGGTNTLPSARSNVAVIQPGECMHIELGARNSCMSSFFCLAIFVLPVIIIVLSLLALILKIQSMLIIIIIGTIIHWIKMAINRCR